VQPLPANVFPNIVDTDSTLCGNGEVDPDSFEQCDPTAGTETSQCCNPETCKFLGAENSCLPDNFNATLFNSKNGIECGQNNGVSDPFYGHRCAKANGKCTPPKQKKCNFTTKGPRGKPEKAKVKTGFCVFTVANGVKCVPPKRK